MADQNVLLNTITNSHNFNFTNIVLPSNLLLLARRWLSISPFATPSSTKNWLRERSPRRYLLGSRKRARTSVRLQGPRRSASFFQLPPSRARAVDQIVATVPRIEVIEGSASRFGPNPSSPKAKEELIVAVVCQESTRAQGVTLEAERTETKSARRRGALCHAWSSVSRAFVRQRQEETKKGAASCRILPSRKTRAPNPRRWS